MVLTAPCCAAPLRFSEHPDTVGLCMQVWAPYVLELQSATSVFQFVFVNSLAQPSNLLILFSFEHFVLSFNIF